MTGSEFEWGPRNHPQVDASYETDEGVCWLLLEGRGSEGEWMRSTYTKENHS